MNRGIYPIKMMEDEGGGGGMTGKYVKGRNSM